MQITIDIEFLFRLDNVSLWALVNRQMQYFIEDELMIFIKNTDIDLFNSAPVELNIRNEIYYNTFVCGKIRWKILYQKHADRYEVIRFITPQEKDYYYFNR